MLYMYNNFVKMQLPIQLLPIIEPIIPHSPSFPWDAVQIMWNYGCVLPYGGMELMEMYNLYALGRIMILFQSVCHIFIP